MRIDNGNDEYVVALLGDLGRDLPESERRHWRAHNIPPAGPMSRVAFRRGFMAVPSDPERPDLLFKHRYTTFCRDWEAEYGWPLYLDAHENDTHLLAVLRTPLTDSQPEFDQQVLNLTKILVDYLNEKALTHGLVVPPNTKGIGKLEQFLNSKGCPTQASVVGFLRDLQQLRSMGAAHRKSSDYKQLLARLGLTGKSKASGFDALLARAATFIDELRAHFLLSGTTGGDR